MKSWKLTILLILANIIMYAKSPKLYNELHTSSLPEVKAFVDMELQKQSQVALEDLHERIGLEYKIVNNLKDANLYIHQVRETDEIYSQIAWGQSWLPNQRNFNGVVNIKQNEKWVIEHETLHALGFVHSPSGLMRANHDNSDDMTITKAEEHYASLIRTAKEQ